LCSASETPLGESGITVEPKHGGLVIIPGSPGSPANFLWVADITLVPQSCMKYHTQDGPVVIFVRSGSIDYAVSSATTPAATVKMGHLDAPPTIRAVPRDEKVTLNSGDWLTQDRKVWFTYRNLGPDD